MLELLQRRGAQSALKVAVFCICLIPFFLVLFRALQNNLGPDPVKELSLETGEWSIRFLIVVLCVTPLRQLTGIAALSRYRRMLGLFVLYYASWHFLVYLMFLLEFRFDSLYEDILERPYVTLGFSAWVILLALGITSPKAMVKKLGRNWVRLHRLVYAAAILAVMHLIWIVRSNISEALLYSLLVAILLGYRLQRRLRSRRRTA